MSETDLPIASVPPGPADPEMLARNVAAWQVAVERHLDGDQRAAAAKMIDGQEGQLLRACFGNSPFLSDCLLKQPEFTFSCFINGYDTALCTILAQSGIKLAEAKNIAAAEKILRTCRRQTAIAAALGDLSGDWSLSAVTGCLSRFADWAIEGALDTLVRDAIGRGALDLDPEQENPSAASGLFIIGMGKLGAGELNYSSDIDLIVLYDPDIVPIVRPDRLQREMVKITQGLVALLQSRTADGYVFRTDLRLRPDPASTPVAMSVDAAEVYYEGMGQNWERAAMIKARIVAGDRRAGDAFLQRLGPFVWRRNLDFAAIQDVHSIKRQINAHRGGGEIATLGHNVKLGRGGIREIEFFAQTQQLIYGGRDESLRLKPTMQAIDALVDAGRVEPSAADDLAAAYAFLRTVEHRLQMVEDRQTHILPDDDAGFAAFATFMGYDDPAAFETVLSHHMHAVERHYAGLFEEAPSLGGPGSLVFTGGEHDPETLQTLANLGFGDPEAISSAIRGWHHGRYPAVRTNRARELLTEMTPALLQAISGTVAPSETFKRFDTFIRSLPAGIQLFSMLHANPGLFDLIADIMGAAPELAATLGRRPALFDALLDQGFFETLPDHTEIAAELAADIPADCGYEEALDAVRRWCADARFRVGVQLLRGSIDATRAGQAFSDIADAVIATILPRVEAEFARRHGRFKDGGFCILALGKLGGRELSSTSDLDLVFVYDDRLEQSQSDGDRPLAISHYYARFAPRLLSALTAPTAEGVPFEVDMRLRPSGNKGPVASSYSAFEEYQRKQAWIWEQMALTRARVVAGDDALAADVMALADRSVKRPRDPAELVAAVADMRARITANRKAPTVWHVKNAEGGLLDIEFIAQYLTLLGAAQSDQTIIPATRDALAVLRSHGALDEGDAECLDEAAALWQTVQAILRLTGAALDADDRPPQSIHRLLCRATNQPDIRTLEAQMKELAEAVRGIYHRLITEPASKAEAVSADNGLVSPDTGDNQPWH